MPAQIRKIAERIDRTVHDHNVKLTLRNLRRGLALLNHPAASANEETLLGALALVGYAASRMGRVGMTVDEFRAATHRMRKGEPA